MSDSINATDVSIFAKKNCLRLNYKHTTRETSALCVRRFSGIIRVSAFVLNSLKRRTALRVRRSQNETQ